MDTKYWLPAKPPGYGWGWGVPLTWQGWAVFVSRFLLLKGGVILFAPGYPGLGPAGVFVPGALPAATCRIAGEPPRHAFRGETLR